MLYAPVIFFGSGFSSIVGNEIVKSLSWSTFLENLDPRLNKAWDIWMKGIRPALEYMFLIGFLISVFFYRRVSKQKMPMQLLLGIAVVLLLLFQRVTPLPRIWIYLEAFFLMYAAAGLVWLVDLVLRQIGGSALSERALSIAIPLVFLGAFAQILIGRAQNPVFADRDLLPEAFAVCREAGRRRLNMRHFDVQLIGGMILHRGRIAEMKTGEGKTLVATLPIYLNALEGKGAHLITVNDYLAKRDAQWMGQIYHSLGLSVGVIQHDASFLFDPAYDAPDKRLQHLRPCTRQEAYRFGITTTDSEDGAYWDNVSLACVDGVPAPISVNIWDWINDTFTVNGLERNGVPAFFGSQRFGYRLNNHILGAMLMTERYEELLAELLGSGGTPFPEYQRERRELFDRGEHQRALQHWTVADRTERAALQAICRGWNAKAACLAGGKTAWMFWISAWQSAIFNHVLDQRLAVQPPERLLDAGPQPAPLAAGQHGQDDDQRMEPHLVANDARGDDRPLQRLYQTEPAEHQQNQRGKDLEVADGEARTAAAVRVSTSSSRSRP